MNTNKSDKQVTLTLNLRGDLIEFIKDEAKELNISIDEFVEQILLRYIAEREIVPSSIFSLGEDVLIAPDVTHKEEWIKGKVIEIEQNPFNGIVITAETEEGLKYFHKEELFIKANDSDLRNELTEEQCLALDKSLEQADNGQTKSIEQCRKEIEEMYSKAKG